MGVLKKLAGETALYGVSSIVGRMFNYLLVPLHTSIFVASEYGVITKIYALVAFLNVAFSLGLETAMFRFSNRKGYSPDEVYSNIMSLLVITSTLFAGGLMVAATPIVEYIGYPGKEQYVYWMSLTLATDAIINTPFARLRLQSQAMRFATTRLVSIGLNLLLNIFFLVICKNIVDGHWLFDLYPYACWFYDPSDPVKYVFVANMLSNAAIYVFFKKEFSQIKPGINWPLVRTMIWYAFPVLLMSLAAMTNEMFGRLVLEKRLPEGFYPGRTSEDALGIFGACYKLSIFMQLTIQAFRYAAEPFYFKESQNADNREKYAHVMQGFVAFCVLLFIGISMNVDLLGAIFLRRPEYYEALNTVPVLLLANLFLGISYNLSIWFKLTDKTLYGTLLTVGGAMLTLVLNYALIPVFGYMGSALATLGCYSGITIVSYLVGQRYYAVPYKLGRILLYLILGVGVVWGIQLSESVLNQNYWVILPLRTFVFVLCFLIILYLEMPARFSRIFPFLSR